jgi:hypothetical protein
MVEKISNPPSLEALDCSSSSPPISSLIYAAYITCRLQDFPPYTTNSYYISIVLL